MLSRIKKRRQASRQAMRRLLQELVSETMNTYEAYRVLYGVWCGNNAAVQELRPLFHMPGIEPDGCFSVTEDFKRQAKSIAGEILSNLED